LTSTFPDPAGLTVTVSWDEPHPAASFGKMAAKTVMTIKQITICTFSQIFFFTIFILPFNVASVSYIPQFKKNSLHHKKVPAALSNNKNGSVFSVNSGASGAFLWRPFSSLLILISHCDRKVCKNFSRLFCGGFINDAYFSLHRYHDEIMFTFIDSVIFF
jgi:hypothetical protein